MPMQPKRVRLPIPRAFTRCLAHGCATADACARHVTIRHDPFDGSCSILPRVCEAGADNGFLPLGDLGAA